MEDFVTNVICRPYKELPSVKKCVQLYENLTDFMQMRYKLTDTVNIRRWVDGHIVLCFI